MLIKVCSYSDSNGDLSLRTGLFYPLNYKSIDGAQRGLFPARTAEAIRSGGYPLNPACRQAGTGAQFLSYHISPCSRSYVKIKRMDRDLKRLERKVDNSQKILNKILAYNRWLGILNIVKWVIVVGAALGVYYYFQPFIDQLVQLYKNVLGSAGLSLWR